MTRSKRRTRLTKGLILVGLACLAVPPTLNWASLRLMGDPLEPGPSGMLSWDRDLGQISPSPDESDVVSVPESRGGSFSSDILSVEDAVQWGDTWIVLDRRLGRIHFLDPGSERVGSVGREGPGPGELQDPVALAVEDSVLWVLNRRGLELDR